MSSIRQFANPASGKESHENLQRASLSLHGRWPQTADKPVRAVTDPGFVTTRRAITPAGTPTVFQGRVYGVAFGANPSELWVLNATRVYRLDWRQNRVLDNAPLNGSPGLQGIRSDNGQPVFAFAAR